MPDLFDGYAVRAAWDEVFAAPGARREHSAPLVGALRELSTEDLDIRATALASAFRDQGITFRLSGARSAPSRSTPTSGTWSSAA